MKMCWCWIEEAYEIMNEADFDMLDESIRGAIPEETGLFKQITLTFNPWNEKHWIRKSGIQEMLILLHLNRQTDIMES